MALNIKENVGKSHTLILSRLIQTGLIDQSTKIKLPSTLYHKIENI